MRKKNDDIQPGHGTPVDVDGGVDFTGSKQQRSNFFGWIVVHLLVARRSGEKTIRGVLGQCVVGPAVVSVVDHHFVGDGS